MNVKLTERYVKKNKEVLRKAESLEGCMNRMCVTDDRDELFRMFAFMNLYAADLYRLNRERLCIQAEEG